MFYSGGIFIAPYVILLDNLTVEESEHRQAWPTCVRSPSDKFLRYEKKISGFSDILHCDELWMKDELLLYSDCY